MQADKYFNYALCYCMPIRTEIPSTESLIYRGEERQQKDETIIINRYDFSKYGVKKIFQVEMPDENEKIFFLVNLDDRHFLTMFNGANPELLLKNNSVHPISAKHEDYISFRKYQYAQAAKKLVDIIRSGEIYLSDKATRYDSELKKDLDNILETEPERRYTFP